MYNASTRARVHVELASPAYLGLGIIYIIILPCLTSDGLQYTRGAPIARLLCVRNYFNNYFATYTRLTTREYAWNSHPPPTLG